MSLETIPRVKIDKVALKLQTIIGEKKKLLNSIEANIEFGLQLVAELETLKLTIGRAKVKMNEEKKEIINMENKYKKINVFTEISTKSTTYEEDILLFAECDSIVENQLNIMNKDSIENINQKIDILIDQIGNQVMVRNVVPKGKNTEHIGRKTKLHSELKVQEMPVEQFRIRSNIILANKGKKVNISELRINPNDAKKLGSELTKYEKQCEECKMHKKFALILGCNCVICIDCLKAIIAKNRTMVFNTFDAQAKKQETICACPNHDCSVNPKILQTLFGGKKLEEECIVAMKKQLKYGSVLNKYYPNICVECKNLIKDERNAVESIALCQKHKICKNCHK